jgi:hypothetical protein
MQEDRRFVLPTVSYRQLVEYLVALQCTLIVLYHQDQPESLNSSTILRSVDLLVSCDQPIHPVLWAEHLHHPIISVEGGTAPFGPPTGEANRKKSYGWSHYIWKTLPIDGWDAGAKLVPEKPLFAASVKRAAIWSWTRIGQRLIICRKYIIEHLH